MGTFVISHGMKYIIVAVDYVLKWTEAITLANNEGKSVTLFLKKNIFSKFCTPRDIISDGDPTFATSCLRDYWKNMGFAIIWPLLTILKLVGKLRAQTRRLRIFWKKRLMLVEQIEQGGLMMHFGTNGQQKRLS